MSITTITGNLLSATEKYIVHQTNCISTSAAGIAKAIFDRFPYADTYSLRKDNYNTTDKATGGLIEICGNGRDKRFVINLHGQHYPGFPQNDNSTIDSVLMREKYFHQGLLRIAKIRDIESIAFPFKIGCGLAGGNWEHYLETLTNFAKYVHEKQNARVVIYQRPEDQ